MKTKMFEIDSRKIGRTEPPYIIAELSANHGGSIEAAKEAIKRAKQSGASAVKIQTYTPDTMTIDSNKADFQINKGLYNKCVIWHAFFLCNNLEVFVL